MFHDMFQDMFRDVATVAWQRDGVNVVMAIGCVGCGAMICSVPRERSASLMSRCLGVSVFRCRFLTAFLSSLLRLALSLVFIVIISCFMIFLAFLSFSYDFLMIFFTLFGLKVAQPAQPARC